MAGTKLAPRRRQIQVAIRLQLLALHRSAAETEDEGFSQRVALVVAMDSAGRVELRFGNVDAACSLLAGASAMARRLADANPSNAALQQLHVIPLTSRALCHLLAGDAPAAEAASNEALQWLRPVCGARRTDPQVSLLFSQALVQAGLNKFVLGDQTGGTALVSEGVRVVSPFARHGAQNPEFNRGVWATTGFAAALNVGRSWTEFLVLSADLERLQIVTQPEIDCAEGLRRELMRLYPTLPR